MFTNTKAQLHVSAINIGHLQVVHEDLINKLYQRVWGVYSLWGGVGARSRFVLEKGVWTGAVCNPLAKKGTDQTMYSALEWVAGC